MPRKLFDLAVKTGSYATQSGETKGRYENVGSVLRMDDGSQMILLKRSFNPAGVPYKDGSDQIVVSMFEHKDKDKESIPAAPTKPPAVGADDDIPF